ncbi:MAG: SAM-dependent methyltransferase, partial [Eubacterium sp.]|nr:SAM-dependent methyltransferase [Eubacterium sp.]
PPYMIGSHGLKNPSDAEAIARHEVLCTFDDIAAQASKVLKDRGRFFLIHRPFRLVEIFGKLTANRLEPKRIRLVYPYAEREPNMVLIEACKGGRSRLTVEKPLFVYKEPGVYTDEIREIYGDGR